jgi:hypothetical protein
MLRSDVCLLVFTRKCGSPKDQYSFETTLPDLAKAAHLRVDDLAYTLTELGFLKHRRPVSSGEGEEELAADEIEVVPRQRGPEEVGEWSGVEVVISRDMVDKAWDRWGVRDKGVLDESCCLL